MADLLHYPPSATWRGVHFVYPCC